MNSETESTDMMVMAQGDDVVINHSLAVMLQRAEVDQQVATARALPRSIDRAMKGIFTLSTLDRESAQECIYALPRGGKPIRGPSVRFAEIIASQWGNCRIGARVVHVDRAEKYVEAEGVFHDLETNMATTARVRRRISDKKGQLLTDDMIIVTGNAACAIAKRNAVLGAVPKAVWRKSYMKVEGVIAGDIQTLGQRRDEAIKAFAMYGVKPDQIYAAIGVAGLADVTIDHIIVLAGMISAIQNGEETVESLFSPPTQEGKRPTIAERLKGSDGEGFNAANVKAETDQLAAPAEQAMPIVECEKAEAVAA